MNLLKVISSDEPISSLEIDGSYLRFSRLKKENDGIKLELLVEEKLTSTGPTLSETEFISQLSRFTKKNKCKYVVISIPSDNIFVKTFAFPLAMSDEKIAESMDLTVDLQLPRKKEEIYYDWMKTEEAADKKILLSFVDKKYINKLISIIRKTGLRIIAIESRAMSLARALKQKKDEAVLLIEKDTKNTSFSVIINNNLLFSQSSPNEKIGANINKEINQIINYHDWFNIGIKNLILIGSFSETEIKKLPLKIADFEISEDIKSVPKDIKWLVPLGAAMRGVVSREDDKMISLMEIGTEAAYRREKANSVANFFIGISAGLAIFFVAAFFVTWSLITSMQNNYNRHITSFNLMPSSENSGLLGSKATAFNNLVSQASAMVKTEPYWSKLIAEIKNKTVSGITINNVYLPSADGVFSITGTASNREAINLLKKSFESSSMLTGVEIPLNNLGAKVDIPFSMTFKIKDAQFIYTK